MEIKLRSTFSNMLQLQLLAMVQETEYYTLIEKQSLPTRPFEKKWNDFFKVKSSLFTTQTMKNNLY